MAKYDREREPRHDRYGGGPSGAERPRPAPGRRTLTEQLPPAVQLRAGGPAAEAGPRSEAGSGTGDAALPSGGGGALPGDVLAEMGSMFGHDFSSVRVRTDASASALGALAYTAGTDIAFQPGHYDPSGASGRELLAHELAHVVQQAHGRVAGTAMVGDVAINDDHGLEHEADAAAARVVRGEPAGLGGGGGSAAGAAQRRVAQRQDAGERSEGRGDGRRHTGGPSAPGSLLQLPVDDLVRLYLARPDEAPITLQVGGAPVEYTAAFLGSDSGRVRMRGALQVRMAAIAGDAAQVERVRALVGPHASEPAGQDVAALVAVATSRSARLGDRAAASTPALVDDGAEIPGRTWAPRHGDARTVDGGAGRDLTGMIHAAQDVTGPSRTGVYAPCAGRVIEVRRSDTYGNLLRLQHDHPPPTEVAGDGPLTTNYAHLDEVLVERGATVAAGEAIGMMGATGLAHGVVHVHWSIQRMPADGHVGGFSTDYECRTDLQIRPDVWLSEIGSSVSAPSAPRATGRRPRSTSSAPRTAPVQRRVSRVVQLFGRDSDTMRAHHERGELHRRHGEVDGPEPSDGAIVHGGADRRPPLTPAELDSQLLELTERRRLAVHSVVPADHVRRVLTDRASYPDVAALWTEATIAAGTASWEIQMSALEARAPRLLHAVENHFITDPGGSGLDVLGAAGTGYRTGWAEHDYPGGTDGPGEARADRMHAALRRVRPERRANRGADAVADEHAFDADARLRAYIVAHLRTVPAFSAPPAGSPTIPVQPAGKQMLDLALDSFLAMRAAALADGVPLVVGAGWRSRSAAQHNAAASGNSRAVAAFSSHTLGLAVDLDMSVGPLHFTERETEPMQQVTDERGSPVHRWMVVRGAAYGWYPLTEEPWHWEYNPPGLRDRVLAAAHGGGGGSSGDGAAAAP
jgi:murein DD-endopeptidase MepM/ murein hydrolase activator NlpD